MKCPVCNSKCINIGSNAAGILDDEWIACTKCDWDDTKTSETNKQ